MICRKCGKKLDDNARFCIYCGAGVEPSAPEAPQQAQETIVVRSTTPKPKEPAKRKGGLKKVIAAIVAAAVVLAVGAAALGVYFSPASKMNRAIAADDFEEALSLYRGKLSGKELSDQSVAKLVEAAMRAAEDYEADEIDYYEATDRLDLIGQFRDAELDDAVYAAWEAVETKWQLDDWLNTAQGALDSREYTSAIRTFEAVLEMDADNEAASEGLQKAKDGQRQSILSEAQSSQAKGDFKTAATVLENALADTLPGDADLQAALDQLDAAETAYTIEQAYAATEAGEWDEALEMLETYQEKKGLSDELKRAYEDIEKKRPITLLNLTMVSSDWVEILDKVLKDRWGNVYDRGVRYKASYHASGYYALEKKYTKFTGTVFPSTDTSNRANMSVSIYKDDQLAFYQDNITVNTAPISFEIDVSGATTMKIMTDADWTDAYIDF
ncbi:MAG: NPCBM/NEW2 domain-containing protein, partial [Butyricicoccus sp.]